MKKKILIILASFFVLIVLAAALIPVLFKDDIRKAIDDAIAENVNARVFYDAESFSVSLFRDFPNLSVGLSDFGVVGYAPFVKDTLASLGELQLSVNLLSVLGDIKINKIKLDRPRIMVMVLEDGTANYDIAMPGDTTVVEEAGPEEETGGGLNLNIDSWEIINGDVIYYDQSLPFYTILRGLNHSGSGNLASDLFNMVTKTSVDKFSLGYDGTEYISEKSFAADIEMEMNMGEMKFTFRENTFSLNEFAFAADGFISMPEENIDMDINFGGKNISMRSILSLIPGAYTEYLDGIDAAGTVGFEGFVRGTYNEESMPAVRADLSIAKGRVAASDAPVPVENIGLKAFFDYPTGAMEDTKLGLDFKGTLQGEATRIKLDLANLVNYRWALLLNSNADLEKLAPLLPLDGATLKGKLQVDLDTRGQLSDLDAGRYDKLPTKGSLRMQNFLYQGESLPQGFGISDLKATLDPSAVSLANFSGNAGKSDLYLKGRIANYLAYVMEEDAILEGDLVFRSKQLDLNEWMTESTQPVEETDEPTEEVAMEVVRLPENLRFVFKSSIDQLVYDNLDLTNFTGNIVIREGKMILENTGFELLGGQFKMAGLYDSKPDQPVFDFGFAIQSLSIPKAYEAFIPMQKLVPVAEKMTGQFSTNFKMSGALGADMMPMMNSISGSGLVEIAEAAVKDVNVLDAINNVTKLKSSGGSEGTLAQLKDVLLSASIQDGRISVKPFAVTLGGNEALVSGSGGVDGSLDYGLAMKVPSGAAGKTVNQALSKFTGSQEVVSEYLDLSLGIKGFYSDPKVSLLSAKPGSSEGGLTASLKDTAKDQATAAIDDAKTQVTQEVKAKTDTLKAEAKDKVDATKKELEQKAKDKVKDLFKKKKKTGS